MAKETKPWKQFEKDLEIFGDAQGCVIKKIPEEIRNFYGKGRKVQVKTCFDFCCGIDGLAWFFDAKHCSKDKFYLKSYLLTKEKVHQWVELQEAWDEGNLAGLMIWFSPQGMYSWVSVPIIRMCLEERVKGIGPLSEGVVSQPDSNSINFRQLLENDIDNKLKELSHVHQHRTVRD